jgi:hypothetical protein
MPFDGPPWLDDKEIELLETWIAGGAKNTDGVPAAFVPGADVRLHGTLGDGWTLDGLELSVGAGVRLDKSPRVGDYVQVRGKLAADGNIRVERIRRRE